MSRNFNFGTVTAKEPEINEVTKEELLAELKMKVWAKRIAKVTGEGLAAFGTGLVALTGACEICSKLLDGYDEENPAGFVRSTAAIGTALLGSFAMTGAWVGGAALIESEIESWSDKDFEIPEVEVEDEDDAFDPDDRIEKFVK